MLVFSELPKESDQENASPPKKRPVTHLNAGRDPGDADLPREIEKLRVLDHELTLARTRPEAQTIHLTQELCVIINDKEPRAGGVEPSEADVSTYILRVVVVLEVGLQVDARCEGVRSHEPDDRGRETPFVQLHVEVVHA